MVAARVCDRGLDRNKLLFLPLCVGFFVLWGIYVAFTDLKDDTCGLRRLTGFLSICVFDRSLVSGLTRLVIEGFVGRKIIGPVVFL